MKLSWKRFAEIAKTVGPLVLVTVNPALAPIASHIVNAIVEAEAIPGASGADKATHVKNIVQDVVLSANSQGAKLDASEINSAIGDGIDTVIHTTKGFKQ